MKIVNATLQNDKIITFGDINIFVGANGLGKTSLLREIVNNVNSQTPGRYWIKTIEIDNLSQNDAKTMLYLMEGPDSDGTYNLIFRRNVNGEIAENVGNDVYRGDRLEAIKVLANVGESGLNDNQKGLLKNDRTFYRNFIAFESTQKRLSQQGQFNPGDILNPKDIYTYLLGDPDFQKKLDKKFSDIFGYHFYVLPHRSNPVYIGFSKKKLDLSIDKHGSPRKVEKWMKENNFTLINQAGDGMHAATTLFFSLHNPIPEIILIDEPEVFIYPTQKKQIAREIKILALNKKESKQTFIVTHDATFLSGLIDSIEEDENIKIFYFKNRKKIISIPLPEYSVEVQPPTKQEKYLQALFHKGVIFSEGPNDRFFYESTMGEIYKDKLPRKDIAFIETGGASNGPRQVVRFVKDSEIKAAFIFDLDMIISKNNKKIIIDQTTEGKPAGVYGLLSNTTDFPELTKLHELIYTEVKIRKGEIGNLFSNKGIIDKDWYEEKKEHFEIVFQKLKKVGIFIVPNGALESWAGKDSDFPYSAAKKIIENPNLGGFKTFSEEIFKYF